LSHIPGFVSNNLTSHLSQPVKFALTTNWISES
jgi:hypothetical protein